MTGSSGVRTGSRTSVDQEARLVPGLPARVLPIVAGVVFAAGNLGMLAIAGDTRGYDLRAYLLAAQRLLDGAKLYDTSADVAGPYGLFLYPPPFALAMLPFTFIPASIVAWAWAALLAAAFLGGAWLMPVRREVRWLTILLAGLSWPFLYSIKLGQVGPLLFLGFAICWRSIDRPIPFGLSAAAGSLMKMQPAVLFGWALFTRRPKAIVAGLAGIAAVALASIPFAGVQAWLDWAALLVRVSSPLTTPHTVSLGTLAYGAGLPLALAGILQWAAIGAVLAVMLFAWLRRDPETSLIVTIVASQLLSPILWDHYAMLLLLPAALLLQRGRRGALAIPLVTWISLVTPWIYPVAFAGTLAWLLVRPGRAVGSNAGAAHAG